MNHQELPELLEIEFEAILPGRKQRDQRYTLRLIIRNFLDKTVRERSADGKWWITCSWRVRYLRKESSQSVNFEESFYRTSQ